jgi:hypothetical protein
VAKQSHDLGVQKRRKAQEKLRPDRLEWERVKRRHPGPLPWYISVFNEWIDRKKPKR